jgi:hypothetical protein
MTGGGALSGIHTPQRRCLLPQGYDVIGDIHGHADALRRLLLKLDYRQTGGLFRHDERKVVFVGDFIDRGPEQLEVLRIARTMCAADTARAVMGNHEFNAIGWATSNGNGDFLRKHSTQNASQHKAFLEQIGEGSPAYHAAIDWFHQLPVWLDLDGLRVVHACWHDASRAVLAPWLDAGNRFTAAGIQASGVRGSPAYMAAEILLKGPEQRLPEGISYLDKGGHERREVRLRWWDRDAITFRQAAIGMEARAHELPEEAITTEFNYPHDTPVLFGHYWMQGEPTITHATAACLDFSVAARGHLTAYRWSGETALSLSNLVHVPA